MASVIHVTCLLYIYCVVDRSGEAFNAAARRTTTKLNLKIKRRLIWMSKIKTTKFGEVK